MAEPRKKSTLRWILSIGLVLLFGAILLRSSTPRPPDDVTSETTLTGADLPMAGRMTPPPPPVPSMMPGGHAGCAAHEQCPVTELCIDGACRAIGAEAAQCNAATVHFTLFLAELGEGEHATLERMARCVRAGQAMTLKIEGSPDPASSPAARLALAERRAKSVAKSLEQRGVPSGRLHLVHYGDNALLCAEADEGCWAENRRASTNTSP